MKQRATFSPPVILSSGIGGEEGNGAHGGLRNGTPGRECPGQGQAQRLGLAKDRIPRTGSANRDSCLPSDNVSLGF